MHLRAHVLKIRRILNWAAGAIVLAVLMPSAAEAKEGVCPRPDAGTEALRPPDLYSQNGVLNVDLTYYTTVDFAGRTLFCFQTPDGTESPTLHVNPGDSIIMKVTNTVPPPNHTFTMPVFMKVQCGPTRNMTPSTVNVHFHGTNTSPQCGSDEVVHTLIGSGQNFTYTLQIPPDEPPGLYWYHPHVHGISGPAVQGGASGLIVVDGIENVQPAVAGLPERLLIIRDQPLQNPPRAPQKNVPPFWDISLNYVPVPYPDYPPAIIKMQSGAREFWRVSNSTADTILDIQVRYDGTPQEFEAVGIDGVPTGSQDGTRKGKLLPMHDFLLAPAGRIEFILTGPTASVANAQLITKTIHGGPASDSNPYRPIAQIVPTNAPAALPKMPPQSAPPPPERFENLATAPVTAQRLLYFLERPAGLQSGQPPSAEGFLFFMVVDGHPPHVFDPNAPPDITTTQGAVEDWTIENRTAEHHEFHIHQIHFLLLARNGVPVPKKQQQFYDTIQVPFWTGEGDFPSVTVRMDFRGATIGEFVYHCHILDHEDGGMMNSIQVLPAGVPVVHS